MALVVGTLYAVVHPAHAAYRLCALRDGPRGPCTCKSNSDGAGQFTVVPKSRCRPAAAGASKDATGGVTEPAAGASGAGPAADASRSEAVTETGALPASGSKLDEIRQRGKLVCGVNTGLLGFSARTESGVWAGLDVDFCRALAAAALGSADKAEFVPLETNERFDALKDGKIDVLSRNTTWTMNREVDLGLRFAGVLYFDGQGFMTSDDRGFVSAQQLSGSKVCVEAGTTTEKHMAYFFKAHQIEAQAVVLPTREETLKAYAGGTCDTYSGDRSALFSDRASFPEPAKHAILPEVISKEPLGPVVLKGDDEWTEIVRWTLAGLINAEEVGLDKASAATAGTSLKDDAQRLVEGAGASGEKLRLSKSWLRDAVAAVGNYGEMFEANVGKGSALGMERGLNALWKRGGILTAPPMW
ncbi:MAG: amino acid ABC transporter substrate-binding protein [Hyphomicrobium sp.]|nr:amino acid ABC transporter substrate-binding protein [Hyphomicrobium sp.]